MTTFGQAYSDWNTFKKHKGQFGIEIETESKKPYDPKQYSFWDVKRDDSLRGPGPYEYILKVPLTYGEELNAALEEFVVKTKDVSFDDGSWTTSVHVHVNMIHETLLTLVNFLTTYSLTENLLTNFAGPTRRSNLFCLPMSDAETNFHTAKSIVNSIVNKKFNAIALDPNQHKYAALNLSSLHSFGSFECRLLRGTTDTKLINTWVGMLYNMVNFSRGDITPTEIVLQWKDRGPELLSDIFGSTRSAIRTDDEISLVDKNAWFAANIAALSKDWRKLNNVVIPVEITQESLEKIAMHHYKKKYDDLQDDQKIHIYANHDDLYEALSAKGDKKKKGTNIHLYTDNIPLQATQHTPQPFPTNPVPHWIDDEVAADDGDNF